jgi:hypothetical protein
MPKQEVIERAHKDAEEGNRQAPKQKAADALRLMRRRNPFCITMGGRRRQTPSPS